MAEKESRRQETVTPKDLEEYRAVLGKRILPPRNNEVATKDAIAHFADGTGDPNPLWRSEDYARKTRYGSIIAPPFFLNAIAEGQAIVGLPSIAAVYTGADWEWKRVVRVNDTITAANFPLDLVEKGGEEGRRRFLQTGDLVYRNQRDEVVAICRWNVMRMEQKERGASNRASQEKAAGPGIQHYTDEELERIYRAYEAEEIQGGKPRYWEEVNVGDELPAVVKGPLSLADMVAFFMGIGWSRIGQAHGLKTARIRKYPGLGYKDPQTGALEPIANVHLSADAARILSGAALPFDLGLQRLCWLGHLMTNWMGDDGFLKRLSGRCRKMIAFGDTTWIRGKVSGKSMEGNEALVECDLRGENQRGEVTTTGQAVVRLPSRSTGVPPALG
jgi:acyl dehydratase